MLDRNIDDPCAWHAGDLGPDDWRIPIAETVLAELDAVARDLATHEGNIEDLVPSGFELSATTKFMGAVRRQLDRDIGFAVLDRLPFERWDTWTSKAVVWLVTSLLGPIVMQKWNGTRVYDVRDTGKRLEHGVRRSITNLEQEFHTDGGWLTITPNIIGLACLQQAPIGGSSRVASLATVHNMLRDLEPRRLARLYRAFWWDRQAEHPKTEAPCSRHPIYASDGQRLTVRYYDDYVRQGQKLMNSPLDHEGAEAIEAMKALVETPETWIEFHLEPGQIEYANNHLLAHARTGFQDAGGRDERRHLLRLWVRDTGGIALEPGALAAD